MLRMKHRWNRGIWAWLIIALKVCNLMLRRKSNWYAWLQMLMEMFPKNSAAPFASPWCTNLKHAASVRIMSTARAACRACKTSTRGARCASGARWSIATRWWGRYSIRPWLGAMAMAAASRARWFRMRSLWIITWMLVRGLRFAAHSIAMTSHFSIPSRKQKSTTKCAPRWDWIARGAARRMKDANLRIINVKKYLLTSRRRLWNSRKRRYTNLTTPTKSWKQELQTSKSWRMETKRKSCSSALPSLRVHSRPY